MYVHLVGVLIKWLYEMHGATINNLNKYSYNGKGEIKE